MKTEVVIVEDYNPDWIKYFNEIKLEIEIAIGQIAISIEHIGSTSVKGLSAKPIIDIDIVIDNLSDLHYAIKRLSSIGYI